jgi:hypothetical protein
MNIDDWLQETDFSCLSVCDTECNGVAISVSQEAYRDGSVYQSMYLIESGRSFKRSGTKQYSYDQWVDTRWNEWELND